MSNHPRVKEVTYHRNGVCGRGFYTVQFKHPETGDAEMVGIYFPPREGDESGVTLDSYAVIDRDHPSNTWRGDFFYDLMREAVAKYEAEQDARWNTPQVSP